MNWGQHDVCEFVRPPKSHLRPQKSPPHLSVCPVGEAFLHRADLGSGHRQSFWSADLPHQLRPPQGSFVVGDSIGAVLTVAAQGVADLATSGRTR